ncbi:MAG: hypothetical protein RIE32_03945 [Phycisphaerales bacterium]
MGFDDLIDFLRLHDIAHPRASIYRYRKLGLRSVRVGRRVWFRLDDVLAFLEAQQQALPDIGSL